MIRYFYVHEDISNSIQDIVYNILHILYNVLDILYKISDTINSKMARSKPFYFLLCKIDILYI